MSSRKNNTAFQPFSWRELQKYAKAYRAGKIPEDVVRASDIVYVQNGLFRIQSVPLPRDLRIGVVLDRYVPRNLTIEKNRAKAIAVAAIPAVCAAIAAPFVPAGWIHSAWTTVVLAFLWAVGFWAAARFDKWVRRMDSDSINRLYQHHYLENIPRYGIIGAAAAFAAECILALAAGTTAVLCLVSVSAVCAWCNAKHMCFLRGVLRKERKRAALRELRATDVLKEHED